MLSIIVLENNLLLVPHKRVLKQMGHIFRVKKDILFQFGVEQLSDNHVLWVHL